MTSIKFYLAEGGGYRHPIVARCWPNLRGQRGVAGLHLLRCTEVASAFISGSKHGPAFPIHKLFRIATAALSIEKNVDGTIASHAFLIWGSRPLTEAAQRQECR